MNDFKPYGSFSSPPCFMHELGDDADDPQAARDVARWRKAERVRLIGERLAVSADVRAARAAEIAARLTEIAGPFAEQTIAVYWPFRGELDLRPWMEHATNGGATIALPVVIEKNKPLEFRSWAPGERLVKGVWNIPVPAAGGVVRPDVVVSPLVGFDGGKFRLGYGGGFYDRTLAAMERKPLTIGIGLAEALLPTIYPQWHDIPMDEIVVA